MNAINNPPELDTSALTALLAEHGHIAILWHIDDVKDVRPDLTEAQCREVLKRCEERHDAGIGIDWDVIELHADELFPAPDDDGD